MKTSAAKKCIQYSDNNDNTILTTIITMILLRCHIFLDNICCRYDANMIYTLFNISFLEYPRVNVYITMENHHAING